MQMPYTFHVLSIGSTAASPTHQIAWGLFMQLLNHDRRKPTVQHGIRYRTQQLHMLHAINKLAVTTNDCNTNTTSQDVSQGFTGLLEAK